MDPLTGSQVRELMPCDSFEWQRIVRRIKMQTTTKLVALLMSTYANADGSHIVCGVVRLVMVTDTSKATIVRHLELLRDMGLIERVKQGNRHSGDSDEYRLTVPSNVLDLPMLDPDEGTKSGSRR
ncbi:hypothetical protein ATM97_06985 [Nocardia sp. MH4]|uniref:helix-turn-helix domain-containing protein n=1 Tax=Nocardia sp. MH4 TaxID=1768677 RepID=UPI001C4E7FA3|nr:helix-turn-helix domain-containing protein [Nocardia sp. MH4]MBW0270758.1 hypothetical protein [Nocardia sp. MH4]